MADRAAPLAALQHRIDDAGFVGATLATVPFLAQVGVRLDPSGPAAARVEAALGFALSFLVLAWIARYFQTSGFVYPLAALLVAAAIALAPALTEDDR